MSLASEISQKNWLPARETGRVVDGTPDGSVLEFCVTLQALPYLADHGFHDMVVLPGSFYIELARDIHRDLFQRPAMSLHRIEFERPVILTDDVTLAVRVAAGNGERAVYEFFEAAADDLRASPEQQPCARLEVDLKPISGAASGPLLAFGAREFLQGASSVGTAGGFYADLRRNGNQYGPAFQVLESVWRSGAEVAGRLTAAVQARHGAHDLLSPPLLDAAPQLLSALTVTEGRTFILKSIERLVIGASAGLGPCWVHASRADATEARDAGLTGAVQVVDAAGSLLWELSGVALAFIDRPADAATAEETRLCVAATFTAEPLEDALRFWSAHFGRKAQVEFAPYNQVFQQLLDPAGSFHGNRSGINLLVLGLEDWWQEGRQTLRTADPARANACFGDRERTFLPNGLEIAHLNRYETDYVYQEIFGDLSYLRHDIQLADGDTVIDIGANIGLFSLFVMSRCQSPAIYAFEPSPRVFDLLRANCAAYGDPGRVHAFNSGVAEKKGTAQFTFYEHSSVFSSFHPDEREDRAAVQAVVRNVMEHELTEAGSVTDEDVEEITADRLSAETIDCPLISVSDIIRENGLQKINLLKIDAEKSEIGILRGIDEEHWPLIEQIVMEIHDRTRAAVHAIEEQLAGRGFRCAVVEEKLLEDSGLFNIYATRRPRGAATTDAEAGMQRKVEEFCTALDTFAGATTAPLVLAVAPRATSAVEATTQAALDAAEKQVLARAARHPQIRTVGSESILARYPVGQLHDAHSQQLGHMPFTPEGYAAIGTALSRAVFNLDAPQIKVVALDCDNTLWQGLCGEDGAGGIAVTAPFRHLQEFMVRQSQAGVLLVLCSKNQEEDVMAVFEQRLEMPLRREHLAAWEINWESKPANLRTLATRLNLGLESFVFIDDNPVECAAVRAGCPEVTVLHLPADPGQIPAFLDHVWIFDRATGTQEDRERSQWYRMNSEREELRAAAPTLRDFLDGLQLRIDVAEATDEQLSRVAQLTVRTNQFNFSSIRRSEGEIRELLRAGGRCLVTSVSDRFGDYGLVGVTLYTAGSDRYTVDTLLLSCRALGKGVEHRMLAEVAARAARDGKATVVLPYRPTDRNEPARAFIEKLDPDGAVANDAEATFEFPAATLAELRYAPEELAPVSAPAISRRSGYDRSNLSAALQSLGEEFTTAESVVAAIEYSRRQTLAAIDDPSEPESPSDASTLERALAEIWKKALGRTRLGFNENFFDAGGTSLKAVVVVAMIRKELKKDVSIVALFEAPTITLLAARLEGSTGSAAAAASAESRGRLRRNKLVKRRVA